MFLRFANETAEALLKKHILIIRRDLADSLAPFRVVVEHARVHANVLRVFRHTCQKCFFQRFVLPIREHLLAHERALLVGHFVRILRTVRKRIHFLVHPEPGKLRRQNAALAVLANRPNDQLALKNMYRQFVAAVVKRPRTLDAHRQPFRLLVGFRPQPGAFRGDRRLVVHVILANFFNAFRHHSIHLIYFYSITGIIFSETVSVYLKSYHTPQELSIFLAFCVQLPAPPKKQSLENTPGSSGNLLAAHCSALPTLRASATASVTL